VSGGRARGSRNRGGATQGRERCLAAEPVGVAASGDEQLGCGGRADSVKEEEVGVLLANQIFDLLPEVVGLVGEELVAPGEGPQCGQHRAGGGFGDEHVVDLVQCRVRALTADLRALWSARIASVCSSWGPRQPGRTRPRGRLGRRRWGPSCPACVAPTARDGSPRGRRSRPCGRLRAGRHRRSWCPDAEDCHGPEHDKERKGLLVAVRSGRELLVAELATQPVEGCDVDRVGVGVGTTDHLGCLVLCLCRDGTAFRVEWLVDVGRAADRTLMRLCQALIGSCPPGRRAGSPGAGRTN
jgi:hypothetical protein